MTDSLHRLAKHLPNFALYPLRDVAIDGRGRLWTADDTTLILLKGHLIIEAELVAICSRQLARPAALADARLGFHARLQVVRAILDESEFPESLFSALARLNKLRNSLAHNLEPKAIDAAISEFLRTVNEIGEYGAISNAAENIPERLIGCITFLCGALSSVGKSPDT